MIQIALIFHIMGFFILLVAICRPLRSLVKGIWTRIFPFISYNSLLDLGLFILLVALCSVGSCALFILVQLIASQVMSVQNIPKISEEIFHSPKDFKMDYMQMERELKIFMYPLEGNDATCYKLDGTYASEGYFLENMKTSRFLTKDPNKAHMFFAPIPCHIRELGKRTFIRAEEVDDYVQSLITRYPYWNRTLGADHLFVSCRTIVFISIKRFERLMKNPVRVLCSSSYNDFDYVPHKDVSLPRVFANVIKTAVYNASDSTSLIGDDLLSEDTVIKEYQHESYRSKFCVFHFGSYFSGSLMENCVPVIVGYQDDLPFSDILDWQKFSKIIPGEDLGQEDQILSNIPEAEYKTLRNNTIKVQKHFQWNIHSVRLDAFHMIMYQLWLRHHVIRYSSVQEASLRRHLSCGRKDMKLFDFMLCYNP